MRLSVILCSAFPAALFDVEFAGDTGVSFREFGIPGKGGSPFCAGVGFREFVGFCAVRVDSREFDGV